MRIVRAGHLLHLYYGRRAQGCFDNLHLPRECGFSPNPYELRDERGWSLDTLPQEYSGANAGDYRLGSVIAASEGGAWGAELRYVRHEISAGKYAVRGMPSAFDRGGEVETLSVTLSDAAAGIKVELLYGVYEAQDVITRAVRVTNAGGGPLRLEKAVSLCLELPFGEWDLLHFHGRHAMERRPERAARLGAARRAGQRHGAPIWALDRAGDGQRGFGALLRAPGLGADRARTKARDGAQPARAGFVASGRDGLAL